ASACEHCSGHAARARRGRITARSRQSRIEAPAFCSRTDGRRSLEQVRYARCTLCVSKLWLWRLAVLRVRKQVGAKGDCELNLTMLRARGIDLALDLARMPALAHAIEKPALPADIFEVMRIAAGAPEVCQLAAQATGQPAAVLIEAARFYLQQVLLRPDADSYRVLGLLPGASREVARRHMRCLLQWLHPDVNRDWDSAYAHRVLAAWREISADTSGPSNSHSDVPAGLESKAP